MGESLAQSEKFGSVRVDLTGGTIDIFPINYILPDVTTLNVALEIGANIKIKRLESSEIKIISKDYETSLSFDDWKKIKDQKNQDSRFRFVSEIIEQVLTDISRENSNQNFGMEIELSSGAPAGSGLGGSSAMGVTLMGAVYEAFNETYDPKDVIKRVQILESRQLDKGVPGYQDYYPAMFGGVLALSPGASEIEVDQCFNQDLKEFYENHISLFFSNKSRFSGINNWEVYKNFFDNDSGTREGLEDIARLSTENYKAIQNKDFKKSLKLIVEEGLVREKLFSKIVTPEIAEVAKLCSEKFSDQYYGMKMCGAGGGGCFIMLHDPSIKAELHEIVRKSEMEALNFSISHPKDLS
ncbi:MAG: hypothetical protein ACPGJV_06000 [Bacteriovoracaceae bacterium]